jgi:DNA-binding response OmpR family regulator
VTDDPLVREAARFGFPSGVEVTFAHDARAVGSAEGDAGPSVVVVDMQTGNAGGYALAKDIAESSSGVPVLILLQRDQDRWLAHSAGAAAHCTKPLRPGVLVRQVLALADAP